MASMSSNHIKHTTESIPIPTSSNNSDSDTKAAAALKGKRSISRSRQQHADVPWTAARCNRLLRTIASRIHILRRLSENDLAEKALRTPKKVKRKRDISVDSVEKLGSKLAAFAPLETPLKGDDPEWFPLDERKPTTRTYAGRGRARKSRAEASSEPVPATGSGFRTPFIKRILRPDAVESPLNDAYSTTSRIGQSARKAKQQDSIQPRTHAERALKTLLDAFDSLLVSTRPPAPAPRRGASSLLGMCVRQVPAYIDLEQHWAEQEEANYNFDATKVVYADLENLGSDGWSGLRDVVRAHAVKMIVDAMDERTWPLQSLDALVEICTKNWAVKESQQILRAWFVCCAGKMSDRLERFVECCVKLGYHGFLFRTLPEQLGCNGRLHEELLESPTIWRELLTAFARLSSRADAAAFLEAYAVENEHSKFDPTTDQDQRTTKRGELLHNVVVLVTALGSTTDNDVSIQGTRRDVAHEVHRIAISTNQMGAQRIVKAETVRTGNEHGVPRTEPFLMSSLMLHVSGDDRARQSDRLAFDTLLKVFVSQERSSVQFPHRKAILLQRAEFVCDVARCLAHVDRGAAQDLIKDTSSGLLKIAKQQCSVPGASALLKELAVSIAMVWAEYRSDNESYVLAEDVEHAASSGSPKGSAIHTPETSRKLNKFRWEASIGEWIATTPAANTMKGRSSLSQDSGIGMSGPESPSNERCVNENELARIITPPDVSSDELPIRSPERPGLASPPETPTKKGRLSSSRSSKDPSPSSRDHVSKKAEPIEYPLQFCMSRASVLPQKRPVVVNESDNHLPLELTGVIGPTDSDQADELAMSPFKSATDLPSTATPSYANDQRVQAKEVIAVAYRDPRPDLLDDADAGGRDELAASPCKAVLRTSMQPIAAEKYCKGSTVEERDELAMTPAARKKLRTSCPSRTIKGRKTSKTSKSHKTSNSVEPRGTRSRTAKAQSRTSRVLRSHVKSSNVVVDTGKDELGL
ncbi:hypothetical protein LTR37_016913 [Vermiconidia calcicola]|uniref:Uncharacterized protein n=1 Tax=Vermiconidia calcicola TaxID=1690605 RepID=A0ACC3MMA7_9PEZI|nr:hypothetical protein LTR37_016913 [Vermiconidia calcicola]